MDAFFTGIVPESGIFSSFPWDLPYGVIPGLGYLSTWPVKSCGKPV